MAGQKYWEAIVKKERRRADDNLQLAARRATEIDRLRVQLTEKDQEIQQLREAILEDQDRWNAQRDLLQLSLQNRLNALMRLQARTAALIDHLVTNDEYTRDMAIIQDVLILIPSNLEVKS